MGNNESANRELSDDSTDSDSDFDYTLESTSEATPANNRAQLNSDMEFVNSAFNLNLGDISGIVEHETEAGGPNKELDLTTDAAMKTCHFPNPEVVLSLDEVLRMEENLDLYEIVSLVYLLYDDAQYALQELLLLVRGAQKTLLYNWAFAEENRRSNWQRKIIEALCIIKNYQILKSLGYQKQDLILHYLPHRPNITNSISSARKVTYLVCEKLGVEKTKVFVQYVKLNFQEKSLTFDEYDQEFLELHFLKWETLEYISAMDLSNVKKILKNMNEEVLGDYLIGMIPQEQKHNESVLEQPPSEINKNMKKTSKLRKPSTSVDTHLQSSNLNGLDITYVGRDNANTSRNNYDDNHVYNIDPENPGILLIINQKYFYTEIDKKFKHLLPTDNSKPRMLTLREGTEKDGEDLVKIFTKYGFKVIVEENLDHEHMISRIKEVVESIKYESSLFICIMSHGDKGIVYGANSCKVKISKIQNIMCKTNKDHLMSKPKVLILQSCQGNTCQKINVSSEEDEDEDENFSLTTDGAGYSRQPRTVDLLTFWATVPGYAAIRNVKTGSWFIQALCKKMEELGNKHHFADICTRITNDVSGRVWTVKENENAMTPMLVSTLRRDFYLPPIRGDGHL